MSRLCIDIDNVLAQTDCLMRKLIRENSSLEVDLTYKDIVHFDYARCQDSNSNSITPEEWFDIHEKFSEESNILSLEPFFGVQDYLHKLIDIGFELHFVTSRLPHSRIATTKWVETHKFPEHRLHFVNHREKHLVLGAFFAVIEDDLEQAKAFAMQETKVYLIAHPWNVCQNTKYLVRVKGWQDVVKQLQLQRNSLMEN